MSEDRIGFHITGGRGFQITFENGYTVSVQFNSLNYCSRRDLEVLPSFKVEFNSLEDSWFSPDAEIAAFKRNDSGTSKWIKPDGWDDMVHGWSTPADVLKLLNFVAGLPV